MSYNISGYDVEFGEESVTFSSTRSEKTVDIIPYRDILDVYTESGRYYYLGLKILVGQEGQVIHIE